MSAVPCRTSGAIFAQQLEIAGLSERLKDLIDIVFVDAPNAASGPLPPDVPDIFKGPYWEWWNAEQDPHTKEVLRYVGWDESYAYIKDYVALHGPFDGFIAFSQVSSPACSVAGAGVQVKLFRKSLVHAGDHPCLLAAVLEAQRPDPAGEPLSPLRIQLRRLPSHTQRSLPCCPCAAAIRAQICAHVRGCHCGACHAPPL